MTAAQAVLFISCGYCMAVEQYIGALICSAFGGAFLGTISRRDRWF